jgi:ribosome-associated heat shock protein Hsp15
MSEAQRLDKWLWFARVVKTRTMAAALVAGGKVRVNRQRAERPSQSVRPGDVVTVAAHSRVRVLRIKAPGVRRGPAAEAATLYEDLVSPTGAKEGREAAGPTDGADQPPPGGGRPTKRDRRMLERLLRGLSEDE